MALLFGGFRAIWIKWSIGMVIRLVQGTPSKDQSNPIQGSVQTHGKTFDIKNVKPNFFKKNWLNSILTENKH